MFDVLSHFIFLCFLADRCTLKTPFSLYINAGIARADLKFTFVEKMHVVVWPFEANASLTYRDKTFVFLAG